MGFCEHGRFIASVVVTGLLLAGCRERKLDFDPPEVKQIACRPSDVGAARGTLVYILDTGLKTVTWANGPDAPEGRLTIEDHTYRFVFPDHEAKVNRFDGLMVREVGHGPFFGAGQARNGNARASWTCAPQAEGPKF